MSSTAALDFDSTLIRRGVQATTISELTRFVAAVEQRPLDKLLSDLPGFATLSETKFNLARAVLRRRLRDLDPAERDQLRLFAAEVAGRSHFDVAERIRALF
ncbi:MAG TPA: hypothetical protein VHK90_07570 [Thermoanaerobaculia bacterium]|nr:hypothetical protein [Thermoanaerobaculia bacterium]